METREAEDRLRVLITEHRAAVLAHTIALTRGDAGWAEDVVQETFLRAWRNWELMAPEHGSVRGWLKRVAHNLVMDGYRSARMRRGEVPLDQVLPGQAREMTVPEPADQVLSAQLVAQVLRDLPGPHRQALEATYLSDQTAAQAARRLGVPVGTVKSRVFYGLRTLRAALDVRAASVP